MHASSKTNSRTTLPKTTSSNSINWQSRLLEHWEKEQQSTRAGRIAVYGSGPRKLKLLRSQRSLKEGQFSLNVQVCLRSCSYSTVGELFSYSTGETEFIPNIKNQDPKTVKLAFNKTLLHYFHAKYF